jgi:hypothetical protein
MPPIDTSKAFADPPFLAPVVEADASGVLVAVLLTPLTASDVVEALVAAISLGLIVRGGAGMV